jgi:myosin-crossreactive antigen
VEQAGGHRFGDVVGEQIPANQRLWDMLVVQAKQRFNTYPSQAASHWIHEEYVKRGGRFVRKKSEIPDSTKRTEEEEKSKHFRDGDGPSKAQLNRVSSALRARRRTV